MKMLEIISGADSAELEEACFAVFDDYLFDINGVERTKKLQCAMANAEGQSNHSEFDTVIQNAALRAIEAFFPLWRLI